MPTAIDLYITKLDELRALDARGNELRVALSRLWSQMSEKDRTAVANLRRVRHASQIA